MGEGGGGFGGKSLTYQFLSSERKTLRPPDYYH